MQGSDEAMLSLAYPQPSLCHIAIGRRVTELPGSVSTEPSSSFCFAGAYPRQGVGLVARRVGGVGEWAGIRNLAPEGSGPARPEQQ